MDYKIHINDTPDKDDYLVVIIIDDKHKTEASFALSRTEKNAGQIRLIKSALAKVKFLNDNTLTKVMIKETGKEKRKRATKAVKKAFGKKIYL